jgi:hypothetical protein
VLAASLGRQAHEKVARTATWSATAIIVETIYRALLAKQEAAGKRRGAAS